MNSFIVKLPENLPADIATEIAKRACYCDRTITGCRFDPDQHHLEVMLEDEAAPDKVATRVNRLVEKMKTERLVVKPRVVRERVGSRTPLATGVFADLAAAGDVYTEGKGVIQRSGRLLELLTKFDDLFEAIGQCRFDAQTREYSVLIPSDWLRRAGYFTSFAHSVTFAMHLREDYDQLEAFANRHKGGAELNFEHLDEITTPEYCLSPAVCYHAYGAMQNSQLDESDAGLKTFTAKGRCFRYESKNITDLDRLWEFSMREIIFIGEKERVLAAREEALELIWSLIEQLNLTASLETASDPFFATDFNSLRFFQLANELKYELQLPVAEGKSIAAASFNYHENFFGQGFNIRTADGEEVHTGCAAFGLERLAFAALARLGFEETINRLDEARSQLLTKISVRE